MPVVVGSAFRSCYRRQVFHQLRDNAADFIAKTANENNSCSLPLDGKLVLRNGLAMLSRSNDRRRFRCKSGASDGAK